MSIRPQTLWTGRLQNSPMSYPVNGEGRGGEGRVSISHVVNHETRMCVSHYELTTRIYVCMP